MPWVALSRPDHWSCPNSPSLIRLASTTFLVSGSFAPSTPPDAADDDLTTAWDASTNAGERWWAQDMTVPVTPVAARIYPRQNGANTNYNTRLAALLVEYSDDAITWHTLATIPHQTPYQTWQAFDLPETAPHRYWRASHSAAPTPPQADQFFSIAELHWLALDVPGTPGRCAPPTSNCASTRYPAPLLCTLATPTSGATVYYTTDGTDPDPLTSTPYTAPITIATSTTVKAIAARAATADSEISTFTIGIGAAIPATMPADTANEPIIGINGTLTYIGGWWYRLLAIPIGGNYAADATCWLATYRSADLRQWELLGTTYQQWGNADFAAPLLAHGYTQAQLDAGIAINRPHLLKKPGGKWYSFWQCYGHSALPARLLIMTADHPQGPWTVAAAPDMPGTGFYDHTEVIAPDGRLYVDYNPVGGSARRIVRMTDDWLAPAATVYSSDTDPGEGLALAWSPDDQVWYELYSEPSDFYSGGDNPNYGINVRSAPDLAGPWGGDTLLDTQHRLQTAFLAPLPQRPAAFLIGADLWGTTDLLATTQQLIAAVAAGGLGYLGVQTTINLTAAFGAGTPPPTPTNFRALTAPGTALLQWQNNGPPAALYVEKSTDSGVTWTAYPLPPGTTEFLDPAPAPPLTRYRITAATVGGASTSPQVIV